MGLEICNVFHLDRVCQDTGAVGGVEWEGGISPIVLLLQKVMLHLLSPKNNFLFFRSYKVLTSV